MASTSYHSIRFKRKEEDQGVVPNDCRKRRRLLYYSILLFKREGSPQHP